MYLVCNMRWRVIHLWLGKESTPELESGVMVVHQLISDPDHELHADGCWCWGFQTPVVSRTAIRMIIPAVVFNLAKTLRSARLIAFSKYLKRWPNQLKKFLLSKQWFLWLLWADAGKIGHRLQRGLHLAMPAFLATGTALVPLLCSFPQSQNTPQIPALEALTWNQPDGHMRLLSFARTNFTQWGKDERLKMNQPFSARVSLLRPFDQDRYSLLPLYDHFSRRFSLIATIPSATVLVFTTSRTWQKLQPLKNCQTENVFMFTREDKFAALLFHDQGDARAPVLIQAVIPAGDAPAFCAQGK